MREQEQWEKRRREKEREKKWGKEKDGKNWINKKDTSFLSRWKR
jgi:hypothetical protein